MALIDSQLNEVQKRDWSHALTRRRLTQYERALADPELISLKQEIARVDIMVDECYERQGRGESSKVWAGMHKLVGKLSDAIEDPEPDLEKIKLLLSELSECTTYAVTEIQVREEVKDLFELRRRLADTERKYEELHKVLIPATQLALLFDDLLIAIETVIPDRTLQVTLLREVRARVEAKRPTKVALPIRLPASYEITTEDATTEESPDVPGSVVGESGGSEDPGRTSAGEEQPGADGGVQASS